MCDTIPGELLVCFHRRDQAGYNLMQDIHNERIDNVQIIEDLGDKLHHLGLATRGSLDFAFYRLRVPVGEENFKVNYLQFFYKHALFSALENRQMDPQTIDFILGWSHCHLQIVPNSLLSVVTATSMEPGKVFQFAPNHLAYKQMLGWNEAVASFPGKQVLILDTGIDPATTYNVVKRKNFVNPDTPDDVSDDNGHGTAIASVICDIYPAVELAIYKVADANGYASEWDTLAALAAMNSADVINVSLAFGLADRVCPRCGRESRASRSAVFENAIDQFGEAENGPILIAAAGNQGQAELAFPARFSNVLAIESVDHSGNKSNFSNHSTLDHENEPHRNVFALPGGQTSSDGHPTEYVGSLSDNKHYWGTSFATAYASGIVAALWAQPMHRDENRTQLLDYLRTNADKAIPYCRAETDVNGMIRFPNQSLC